MGCVRATNLCDQALTHYLYDCRRPLDFPEFCVPVGLEHVSRIMKTSFFYLFDVRASLCLELAVFSSLSTCFDSVV